MGTINFDPKRLEEFIVILFGGTNDANGIGILNGKIIHIPGNNPEGYNILSLGMQALRVSESASNPEMKKSLHEHGMQLVQQGKEHIMKGLQGSAAAGR